MNVSRSRWAASLLLILCLSLTASSSASGEFRVGQKGEVLTEECLVGTLEDGRDILASLKTERAEKEAWKSGYERLERQIGLVSDEFSARLDELERSMNAELDGLKAEHSRVKRENLLLKGLLILGGAAAVIY